MVRNQTPGSVRIRTDEGNEWRYDAIEKAATFYDCNRSNAVAFACEDVDKLVRAARHVLERDDLTREQRREIAETLSTRAVTFEVETAVSVTKKGDEA
ncbi:DUF7692 domain-containing protein [Natrarchaeobius chitinivorans]|uniref:DUF7692 domain-containing protein n=1 Tax=Natrarchaeobius chitinivorans TaxID=1679083 RepID=A0A3N6M1L5_NATCH|nr:hypothetical protein [Natrarchaeobius chitinivorans]RQG97228.1 hypothetical protein EA473_03925 [Natrarchaeobius chitinivorans]